MKLKVIRKVKRLGDSSTNFCNFPFASCLPRTFTPKKQNFHSERKKELKGFTSIHRNAIIPLSTCQTSPCPVLIPKTQERCRVEKVQKNAMKIIKGLQNMPYEERLKKPSLLGEETAWEDLITVLLYIQGGQKEEGGSVFTQEGQVVTMGGFHCDVRKIFFAVINNLLLEQPPRRCGRVPINGGFQDVMNSWTR